ncbi:WecB/TagA/CpsF family glycosyltransferase [Bradyrhizobium sp. Tv2a-2]|uniref:WecB/TagA/CpsF family glycosyltransferase n=1 Tax=Bradyrhizobium sp. Tv2a-2 TaxID=113395 RepID=UPI000414903A|nr:WecB/TagA/CpsF family glycosyltransferase [Bradyrhizobium sp. Tv2a-2]
MQMMQMHSVRDPGLATLDDQLSREVFGILGIPIDGLGLSAVLQLLHAAIEARRPFLLSTPNVNFLIASLSDRLFHDTLLASDLCPVDGMPIVWIARLLGVRLRDRVSGADIFSALKYEKPVGSRRTIFLFGGPNETATQVGEMLNAESLGLKCVDAFNPGFGSVDEISRSEIVDRINASRADILAVFLNAKKAQDWLFKNHDRLDPPVRAQFGATINFEVGAVRRAPGRLQRLGLEWLWRIREEPYLWRRYWADGLRLLRLVFTRVLPFVLNTWWLKLRASTDARLTTLIVDEAEATRVCLLGSATKEHVVEAVLSFRQALDRGKPLKVDMRDTETIDPRFLGLLLMVRKELRDRDHELSVVGTPPAIRRAFRLNGFDFLLFQEDHCPSSILTRIGPFVEERQTHAA